VLPASIGFAHFEFWSSRHFEEVILRSEPGWEERRFRNVDYMIVHMTVAPCRAIEAFVMVGTVPNSKEAPET